MTADTRVDVRVDTLVLPAGIGDERTVREALHEALGEAVATRLADGIPHEAAEWPDVTVALRDPLPTNPIELGRLVAAHVVREVLP
jgi:hypothetical protein